MAEKSNDQAKLTFLFEYSQLPPGDMRALDLDGFPPLAAFNADGQIYVTSNICTHNTAILTEGSFEGETVECPLHGGCFNVRTGEAVMFPCRTPLSTYEVVIEEGSVYLVSRSGGTDGGLKSAALG